MAGRSGAVDGITVTRQVVSGCVRNRSIEFKSPLPFKKFGHKKTRFVRHIPGYLLSSILYEGIAAATSLPLYMTLERALWVFVLTIIMCMISGGIAIRKLGEADPAELF